MALVVDSQNASDSAYTPLAPRYEAGTAFQAALALVFEGRCGGGVLSFCPLSFSAYSCFS